jgi:hypothetical protein
MDNELTLRPEGQGKHDEMVIYQSEDGSVKVDVLFEDETVWLSQQQMAMLFQKDRTVITRHISNIFAEGELDEKSNVHFLHFPNSDKPVRMYSLDVIISVGYRVKSYQGTQFRIWATKRLHEYIIKGVALNDERFKRGNSMNYFRDLLERIREIRLSERVFYQQIKDIYKTSIDYDPSDEMTLQFFKEVQNKLLWAVSGKTAAELVYYRANAALPQMGLTSTEKQGKVLKSDIDVGKNYLTEDEVGLLKLIVEQYLAFAEAQARAHVPMYMRDWVDRLRMVLTMNQRSILEDAGRISHELALQKANEEYAKYQAKQLEEVHLESLRELDADMKLFGKEE